jgi:hypothetical protein
MQRFVAWRIAAAAEPSLQGANAAGPDMPVDGVQ